MICKIIQKNQILTGLDMYQVLSLTLNIWNSYFVALIYDLRNISKSDGEYRVDLI